MKLDEYQQLAKSTRAYPHYGQGNIGGIAYCALGFAGEAGEVANKVKKLIRDGDTVILREKIWMEIGDALWYAAMLADELGISLSAIAERNLQKLKERKEELKIKGEGDER